MLTSAPKILPPEKMKSDRKWLVAFILGLSLTVFCAVAFFMWEEKKFESFKGERLQENEKLERELERYKENAEQYSEEVKRYRRQADELRSEAKDFRDQASQYQNELSRLREQVKGYAKDRSQLKTQLVESESKAGQLQKKIGAMEELLGKALTPQVLRVNRDFNYVVVNLGLEDGVKMGDTVAIEHQGFRVAMAQVEKLYDNFSAATLIEENAQTRVQEGDVVHRVPS